MDGCRTSILDGAGATTGSFPLAELLLNSIGTAVGSTLRTFKHRYMQLLIMREFFFFYC